MSEYGQRQAKMREYFRKAAELIEERGWCQGNWQDSKGRLSMMGAVAVAIYGELPDWLRVSSFDSPPDDVDDTDWMNCLYEMTDNLKQDPETWNDFEHRVEDQVLARLRYVIK